MGALPKNRVRDRRDSEEEGHHQTIVRGEPHLLRAGNMLTRAGEASQRIPRSVVARPDHALAEIASNREDIIPRPSRGPKSFPGEGRFNPGITAGAQDPASHFAIRVNAFVVPTIDASQKRRPGRSRPRNGPVFYLIGDSILIITKSTTARETAGPRDVESSGSHVMRRG